MKDPAPGAAGRSGGAFTRMGRAFSLMTLPGFAPAHKHAFVLRGRQTNGPLFKPGVVPRDTILSRMDLPGANLHMARQVHGVRVLEVPAAAWPTAGGTWLRLCGGRNCLSGAWVPLPVVVDGPRVDASTGRALRIPQQIR